MNDAVAVGQKRIRRQIGPDKIYRCAGRRNRNPDVAGTPEGNICIGIGIGQVADFIGRIRRHGNFLVHQRIQRLFCIQVIMPLEENIHIVGHHQLVNGQAPAGAVSIKLIIGGCVPTVTSPFGTFGSDLGSATLPAGMVSKHKFEFGIAVLQRVFQPGVLGKAKGPVPIQRFGIDAAIAVHIQHHEEGIAPGPGEVVFRLADAIGFVGGVAGVKAVRIRIGIIIFPPLCAIYGNVLSVVLLQVKTIFTLVVAEANIKRHGVANFFQVLQVIFVQVVHVLAGSGIGRMIITKNITQRHHKIGTVFGLIGQGNLVHVAYAFLIIQVFIGFEVKAEGRTGSALGVKSVLRRSGKSACCASAVAESVVILGVSA